VSFRPQREKLAGPLGVRIAALVASCSAVGCSDPSSLPDAPEIGAESPSSAICAGSSFSMVEGLHLPKPVHYLAWDYSGSPSEEAGRICESAEEVAACGAALAAIRADATTNVAAVTHYNDYHVYTRHDEVGPLVSADEVLEFLGRIDTANEAAVVLQAKYGVRAGCGKVSVVDDGYLTAPGFLSRQVGPISDCWTQEFFAVHVSYDGTTSERLSSTWSAGCIGRRPAVLLEGAASDPRLVVGSHFARAAELELAAVAAFAELEHALASHGAPSRLLERCRAARREEIRHAALMTELALRHGSAPEAVRFAPQARWTVLELALENAREGTSRELFGAAVAAWQARTAASADTRACFAEVARDEAAHAQLSLDLAAWFSQRLSRANRALVDDERERSFQELDRELAEPVDDQVVEVAGMPSASRAQQLLRAVRAALT